MRTKSVRLLGLLIGGLVAPSDLFAATFTVVNTGDSGAGSLRQAILDANSQPNAGAPDQIHFAIPGAEVHTIAPLSALPKITEAVLIDGLTQPGANGNSWPPTLRIVLSGSNLGANADGLALESTASSSTLRGLVINQFSGAGIRFIANFTSGSSVTPGVENSAIHCNFIGTDATGTLARGNGTGILIEGSENGGNQVGGGTPETRNLLSGNGVGLNLWRSRVGGTVNRVEGNFIGTDVTGTLDLGNSGAGVVAGAGAPKSFGSIIIGGTTSGARNIISGNDQAGLAVTTVSVLGNYIGTDVTGTAPLGNGGDGIVADTAVGIQRNVIAANAGSGVRTRLFCFNTGIQGNFIGTDLSGTLNLGNGLDGVTLTEITQFTVIGKFFDTPEPALPNVIAFNQRDGVRMEGGDALHNVVNYNSIFGNGGLGINLNADGVTPNDADDSDSGTNGLQNFPVLTSAITSGSTTTVEGTLKSTPNFQYTLQFFASTSADPTTYGEGQTWLGDLAVTTDGNGNATFSTNLSHPVGAGTLVTATATLTDNAASSSAQYNSTSEFSQVIRVAGTSGRLLNIATRLRVQSGESVLIGGFIITGSAPKKVAIRAIGPSLSSFFSGALANPTLQLFQGGTLLQSNDDWKTDQQSEIEAIGLQPANDLESVIVRTLDPGGYTAIVRGVGGNTGIGLVEAYDLGQAANSELANIATRGFVESGNDVMIGGFIAGGGGGGAVKVVVRALGPTLSNFGIAGALQDPTLELRDRNGALIADNNDWKQTQQADLQQTGLTPADDRESAILAILNGGNYTAIVRGNGNTTGVAIVEVYNLP